MTSEEREKLEQRFMKLTNLVNNSFIVDNSIYVELEEIEKKLNDHYKHNSKNPPEV